MNDRPPDRPKAEPPWRIVARRATFGLALAGLIMTALIAVTGGFDLRLIGMEIRGHRPLRSLLIAGIALIAFVALGGRASFSLRHILSSIQAHLALWERLLVRFVPPARVVAAGLAACVCLVGFVYGTKVGGGADSYGYVSQAELWLRGWPTVDQPFTAEVPWPRAGDSFTPLGYKSAMRDGVPMIVPTYAPGLPLLLAAAKFLGGHDAMFLVVPLLGGLLVLATYGIGCRLGSPDAGLVGSWLVATSPPVLLMLMSPMTDVPVAAMWAASFYLLTGTRTSSAVGAGLAASVAILIRPNLVPLAAVAGLHYALGVVRSDTRRRAIGHAALFALGVLPGVIATAVINDHMYGSALMSGYGRLSSLFAWAHIGPNLDRYLAWLIETHTAFVLVGFVALALPTRRLWPGLRHRGTLAIAGLVVLTVWALYSAYLVLDAWWYLRFLLTSWPFIMVGVGAVAMAIWRAGVKVVRVAVIAAVIALGLFNARVGADRFAFDSWKGERRFATAGQMAGRLTPPNSVVLSMQHSGTIRYYGGRMTMRYDQLDPGWLDQAIAWLGERGIGFYLLVEDWELPRVASRFAGARAAERMAAPPLAIYQEPGRLLLFDLSSPDPRPETPQIVTGVDEGLRAVRPAPPPTLTFGTRVK